MAFNAKVRIALRDAVKEVPMVKARYQKACFFQQGVRRL
jgi:hypothetical protein